MGQGFRILKTAETIAHNGSGKTINHSDERWFIETLYRKKSGEFFLYGSGGIFTKYAKQTGPNSWKRSEVILPLTEDEAKQWAMNNLGDDGYRDTCQRIEDKPVPVVKEKRQYTRRESAVTPEEVETAICREYPEFFPHGSETDGERSHRRKGSGIYAVYSCDILYIECRQEGMPENSREYMDRVTKLRHVIDRYYGEETQRFCGS